MLAIQYTKKREFYNWFGCHLKYGATKDEIKQRNKRVKTSQFRDVLVLPASEQDLLHHVLHSSLIKREGNIEYIVRPDIVAYLLMGKEIILNITDKQVSDKIDKHNHPDVSYTVKQKEEDESWMYNSIVKMRYLIRNATKGNVVKLVEFDHMIYQLNIPSYISMLKEHFAREGHLHTIPVVNLYTCQNDIYFIRMFKERVTVQKRCDIPVSIDSSLTKVLNVQVSTIKELTDILTIAAARSIEVMLPTASELHFGKEYSLICKMPLGLTSKLKGMLFKDIFKFCMITCQRKSFLVEMFPVGLKLTDVTTRSSFVRSVNVTIVTNKIKKEIDDLKGDERVNIIMIANKGEGKSTASSELAKTLTAKYNYEVKCFSSDSYGRYLTYLCEKYNVDHPQEITEEQVLYEINNLTQEKEASLDIEDNPSWYEQQAEKILIKYGIIEINGMMFMINRERKKLEMIKNEFKEVMIERLESKATMSFSSYFEALQGASGTNRIAIFECHNTEESKQAARADITFRLEPITNGLGNLIERQRGTEENNLAEILLYLVYDDLIGRTNPSVYLSDILQMF